MLLNHGSQFDAHQLLNILFPFSKNPETEEGRICIMQPCHKHTPFAMSILKYIHAVSHRINKVMRDSSEKMHHMDSCQGKAIFTILQSYNMNTIKGRNEIFKLFFDKKTGIMGSIYQDVCKFETIYPETNEIFKKRLSQLKNYNHIDGNVPPL